VLILVSFGRGGEIVTIHITITCVCFIRKFFFEEPHFKSTWENYEKVSNLWGYFPPFLFRTPTYSSSCSKFRRNKYIVQYRARICKRLGSPGIDLEGFRQPFVAGPVRQIVLSYLPARLPWLAESQSKELVRGPPELVQYFCL
jgi:hypothetical protein